MSLDNINESINEFHNALKSSMDEQIERIKSTEKRMIQHISNMNISIQECEKEKSLLNIKNTEVEMIKKETLAYLDKVKSTLLHNEAKSKELDQIEEKLKSLDESLKSTSKSLEHRKKELDEFNSNLIKKQRDLEMEDNRLRDLNRYIQKLIDDNKIKERLQNSHA